MSYVLDACALMAFLNQETGKGFEPVKENAACLPITIVDTISETVYRQTAHFKSHYSMSLAVIDFIYQITNLAITPKKRIVS